MLLSTFAVLYVLFCRAAVRRNLVNFDAETLRREYAQLKSISPEELIVLGVSCLLVLLWFTKEGKRTPRAHINTALIVF